MRKQEQIRNRLKTRLDKAGMDILKTLNAFLVYITVESAPYQDNSSALQVSSFSHRDEGLIDLCFYDNCKWNYGYLLQREPIIIESFSDDATNSDNENNIGICDELNELLTSNAKKVAVNCFESEVSTYKIVVLIAWKQNQYVKSQYILNYLKTIEVGLNIAINKSEDDYQRELTDKKDDFLSNCLSVGKDIVSTRVELEDCIQKVLESIRKHLVCGHAVYASAIDGQAIVSSDDPKLDNRSDSVQQVLGNSFLFNQLETTKKNKPEAMIINDFEGIYGLNPRSTRYKTFKHAMVLPVYSELHYFRDKDDKSDSLDINETRVIGAIILFNEEEQFDDSDKMELERIDIGAFISSAQNMPFRAHKRSGKLAKMLFGRRAWAGKEFGVRSGLEFSKTVIFLVAFLITFIPIMQFTLILLKAFVPFVFDNIVDASGFHSNVISGYLKIFRDYFIGAEQSNVLMDTLLNTAELPKQWLLLAEIMVMLFTFSIVSIGLLILLRPIYAAGLPSWIQRFTKVDELKNTILTLVVILLAISFLNSVLKNDNMDGMKILYSAVGLSMLIFAIAIFSKLNLQDRK